MKQIESILKLIQADSGTLNKDNLDQSKGIKMLYKEKKFTKDQIKRIERIDQLLKELRISNVEAYASGSSLTFYREENLKFAEENKGLFGDGVAIRNIIIEIDGIAKDDCLRYSKGISLKDE